MPGFERTSRNLNDWLAFEVGARTLVHYQNMEIWSTPALHLYVDNSQLQIGPPPMLAITPFEQFSPHAVALGFGLVMCALGVASLAALESCAKTLAARHLHTRITALAFVIGVVVVGVWCHEMGIWRHLDDAMAITSVTLGLWLCARHGPWWVIALVLGTGVASKPWVVVAVPFLLGLPRPLWGRTALLLLATAAAWWSPFVIAAPSTVHALASYRTHPGPGSILNLLGVTGDVSGWLRPAQFAAGIAVASFVAAGGRWVAAPLAGLAARVAFDPYAYPYYGLGPLVAAVIVDLSSGSRFPRWTALTMLVEFCIPMFGSPAVGAIDRATWCVIVLVWCTRNRRDGNRPRFATPNALERFADQRYASPV